MPFATTGAIQCGHWEDDTLVVDIVGFNEQTWLDYFGLPTPTCCMSSRSTRGPSGRSMMKR